MDNLKSIVKGTKQGKWAVAFAALAVLSLVAAITGGAGIGSAITSFAVFLIVAGVLVSSGKKKLSAPTPQSSAAPAPADTFKPSKKIGKYLYVDEAAMKWRVPADKKNSDVYSYADLMDFELIEDGNTVSKGSVINAAAGGLMFGTVGAIVGAGKKKTKETCTKMQVKITVNNMQKPVAYIDLLGFETKKDGDIYKAALKSAEEITAVLHIIKSSQGSAE